MKLQLQQGTTSYSAYVFIQDTSVTTGSGLTGLVYNTAGLTAYYVRPGGSAVSISLVTQTPTGAFSSGGFVAVDGTNLPGLYRLDVPNAAIASGVNSAIIMLKGAANMAPVLMEVELTAYNPYDAVRLGLTGVNAGYQGGYVWVDTVTGVAGTTSYVNGTADNPSNSLTNAYTLLTNLNMDSLYLRAGSAVTLAASSATMLFDGEGYTVALGGQNIDGTLVRHAAGVSGTGTWTSSSPIFDTCVINSVTLPPSIFVNCGLSGTITVSATGTYNINKCESISPTAVTVDMGAAVGATNMIIRKFSGSLTLNNVQAGDVVVLSDYEGSTLTINGTGGSVTVSGITTIVDGSGGAVTITKTNVLNTTVLATPTNITAGTITTVTNLTNAPTNGDFTATMKTSLNNSTPASITGAVGSVTGNVGGNVVGSVGSVTGTTNANVTSINSVSTASVVTVGAYQGTTQPLNFTGSGGSALVKGDTIDVGSVAQTPGDIIAYINGIGTAGGAAILQDATTSNATGAISGVTSGTTFVGTQTGGTYSSTSVLDGAYNVLTAAGGTVDIVYQFIIPGGCTPITTNCTNYINSGSGSGTFYAWNHVGAAWEQIGTQAGQGNSTNVVKNLILYSRHVGTAGAETGKVYIRIAGTMASLHVDQLNISYAISSRSVGYQLGAIWVDTVDGAAGSVSWVNGTADNPVNNWADALTLATNLSLNEFRINNGSTITLTSSTAGALMYGEFWSLALGGQNIAGAYIHGATVTGTSTGAAQVFEDCDIGTSTIYNGTLFKDCRFTGTITLGAVGTYTITGAKADSSVPTFNFNSGASTIICRNYQGGIITSNMVSGSTLVLDIVGGPVTLGGANATVSIVGIVNSLTNNLTGSPTVDTVGMLNQSVLATPTNITAGTITTVTNLTNAPTNGDFTATMKSSITTAATAATPTVLLTPGTGTGQVTLASGILTANANGDFTATQKTSLNNSTPASITGSVGSVTGNVGGNVVGSVGSVTGNIGGISGVTIPSTIASPTNITAGTITTVTNLTNAPTNGDFTATQKTSLNNSTPASITGSVGSVTGNVGGNVVGSVGSVTGLTASNLDATISSRLAAAAYTAPDNSDIAAIKTQTDKLAFSVTNQVDANIKTVSGSASNVKKNQTLNHFTFIMTDHSAHNPITGAVVSATRSLDGASFASCLNSVTEVGFGVYEINLAAGDLNANSVTLRFTATGCDDRVITIITQP